MKDAARRALCNKLKLAEEASDEAILAGVDAMAADRDKALNSAQTPPLEKFVPRADHDQVKADLEKANNRLKQIEDSDVEKLVDAAIADMKISASSRDYHLANARNNRQAFEDYIASAPKLPIAEDSGLDGKKPDDAKAGKLDEADKAMCASLGLSEEAFLKTKQEAA